MRIIYALCQIRGRRGPAALCVPSVPFHMDQTLQSWQEFWAVLDVDTQVLSPFSKLMPKTEAAMLHIHTK